MWKADHDGGVKASYVEHGVQCRMVLVVNFFVVLKLLFFALLLINVTSCTM